VQEISLYLKLVQNTVMVCDRKSEQTARISVIVTLLLMNIDYGALVAGHYEFQGIIVAARLDWGGYPKSLFLKRRIN
jgi:hypothetical protein